MNLIGFKCKKCNKPFFAMHNTPQAILDDSTAIKRYQRKGFKFVELEPFKEWCNCKNEKAPKTRTEKS